MNKRLKKKLNKQKKILERATYQAKFDQFILLNFNYILQEGEKIVQCKEPYPPYWFVSNMGYAFSVYGKEIKILKPCLRKTGSKNKGGERAGKDWYFTYYSGKKKKKVSMHKLISEHFVENEFCSTMPEEVHHKRKKNSFADNEPQKCNCASNLQRIPKDIHKNLTMIASKTAEQRGQAWDKKINESGCPRFYASQEDMKKLLFAMMNGQEATPIIYGATPANRPEDIEAVVHPVVNLKYEMINGKEELVLTTGKEQKVENATLE